VRHRAVHPLLVRDVVLAEHHLQQQQSQNHQYEPLQSPTPASMQPPTPGLPSSSRWNPPLILPSQSTLEKNPGSRPQPIFSMAFTRNLTREPKDRSASPRQQNPISLRRSDRSNLEPLQTRSLRVAVGMALTLAHRLLAHLLAVLVTLLLLVEGLGRALEALLERLHCVLPNAGQK
jgi:hypothetical protein